ncbi:hypothetical protein An15g07100 [Aspergillus niger]|uniref:Uncharacterized protein n=3 Tax=Aspergillus niger TaxID=5061 RepID=A2R695_ASPNC|nr:hypothetical protein An15g07100 [Aspergillus niger]CAK48545.1 hypothetical protein An15g07100 [Aspergillus niger]
MAGGWTIDQSHTPDRDGRRVDMDVVLTENYKHLIGARNKPQKIILRGYLEYGGACSFPVIHSILLWRSFLSMQCLGVIVLDATVGDSCLAYAVNWRTMVLPLRHLWMMVAEGFTRETDDTLCLRLMKAAIPPVKKLTELLEQRGTNGLAGMRAV